MDKFKAWWRVEQEKELKSGESMLKAIPKNKRRSTLSLMAVSFGWAFLMLGLVIGESVARAENAKDIALGILIGNSTLFVICFLVGYVGYKTGFNNAMVYRFVFGKKGMILPGILVTIVGLGWQASFIGMFTEVWVGSEVTLTYIIIGIFAGILITYTCYKGIKGIEYISWPSIIIFSIVMFVAIVYSFNSLGGIAGIDTATQNAYAADPVSMATKVNMVIGSWIVGAMFAGDFIRFCKSAPGVFWFVAINFFFVQPLLQIMGALGFLAFGTYNPGMYLAVTGSISWILIMVSFSLAVWTTGNTNLYFTQTPLANMFKVPRRISALVLGIIATIIGAFGMFNYLETFVGLLASIVPPIFGPLVIDFYLIHKRKYNVELIDRLPIINYQAIAAYLSGVVIPLIYTPNWLPSSIWAIIISVISYALLAAISIASGKKFGYLKTIESERNSAQSKTKIM